MTDNQEQLRHWQELAEQLGLDVPVATPASPEVSKEEPLPTPRTENPEEKIEEPENVEDRETMMVGKCSSGVGNESFPETGANLESSTQTPLESPLPIREPERDDQRRGRRGRRDRNGDRGERSSRSRRGSSRRRGAELVAEDRGDPFEERESKDPGEFPEEVEPAILHDSTAMEREMEEEEDVDDVDTLSDWNVPSWTELIDSLYRPER
jgi:ribonuclease E